MPPVRSRSTVFPSSRPRQTLTRWLENESLYPANRNQISSIPAITRHDGMAFLYPSEKESNEPGDQALTGHWRPFWRTAMSRRATKRIIRFLRIILLVMIEIAQLRPVSAALILTIETRLTELLGKRDLGRDA